MLRRISWSDYPLAIRSATAVLALLAACAATQAVAAQGREVHPGGLDPARTLLTSPLTGVTFRLPEGFRAEWDPALGGLLALAPSGVFWGIWGWSEGTVEEVASEVGRRLEEQGITLEARGAPEFTDEGFRGVFDARTATTLGVLLAVIRRGPDGSVVALVGLGESAAQAQAEAFVEGLLATLEWSSPGVMAWGREVTGFVLRPAAAPGDAADAAALSFCSPTLYAFRGPSTSTEHTGAWWLVADLAGTATLFLEASDGRLFQWAIEAWRDGFRIDGRAYTVSGAC
jgi:hypothetical protein